MVRGRLLIVLASVALWLVPAENSTGNSTSNSTNSSTDGPTPLQVELDIQGQSGAFTVYDKSKGKGSGVMIKMDALREVDASGNSVGASGNTKHSINSFATQDFTIGSPENVTLGDTSANKIAFSSPVKDVGQISVDTYVMSTSGTIGTPTENWTVAPGDLKWNINLSSWTWCGCKKGKSDEVGAFIDLEVTVKGKQDAKTSGAANKTLDLGDGLSLQLSDQVQVDGKWVGMPAGYPHVSIQGSSTTLTFRFPKFNESALYDPVISGFAAASTTTDSTTGASTTIGSTTGSGAQVDGNIQAHPTFWVALLLLTLAVGHVA